MIRAGAGPRQAAVIRRYTADRGTVRSAVDLPAAAWRRQKGTQNIHDTEHPQRVDPVTPSASRLALRILAAFVLSFIAARGVVFLIMSRTIPDLYLHVGGTHVHHLNYGIFLLAGVGAFMIFRRPAGRRLNTVATIYGVGLGLTFDEFGMWLHLGGGYWQRASYDAVVVIASLLGLIVAAPSLKRIRSHHWVIAVMLLAVVVLFLAMLGRSIGYAERSLAPRLERLDAQSPP